MLAVAGVGLTSVVTSALFTDSDIVGANTFSSGNVSLTTDPTTTALTLSGMAPGALVTAPITVNNNGTLALRYAVRSVTTDSTTLPAQLDFTIKSGVVACDNVGFGVAGSTVVYATGDLGSAAGINIIGDPAPGAQGGERPLAASGSEVLCAQAVLPTTTDDTFQGLTTTATLTFTSEQTANN